MKTQNCCVFTVRNRGCDEVRQIGVDFPSCQGDKPDTQRGYVEDLSTQSVRKRCAKSPQLNVSVLP